MALTFGASAQFIISQNMCNLEAHLKRKGYGIANFLDEPINSAGGSSFQLQDPAKAAELTALMGLIRERRVLGIGNVYPQGNGILVRAYGEEYFQRLKKDLEGYADRTGVDITVLLDKEEPEFHYPDRDVSIS